jgi:hypothetical protein
MLSMATGRPGSLPRAVRTRSAHRLSGDVHTHVRVPLAVRLDGREDREKPEAPVMENRKNPVSSGWLTYTIPSIL